ncbi:hypothetical protein P8C59_007505 [Phyllachora maydis]|uniref:Branched-chain-amino-acid aminotransferase n=1 Tax=Phyllachora maydis TaxID=1825666 RepID=A0AAD9IAD3_9PEZI|nr:hypothetical protein P8C59_007505 [Phyllachora maydis]
MAASTFPPPPVNTIDWANVGFKVREVNGHIECHYSAATGAWSPPVFVTDPYVRLHGMAPALNYGQQAYEGLKAFRHAGTPGRVVLFRPDRNATRLQHSAAVISVPTVPAALFLAAVRAAVALNAAYVPPHATGAALYVRPQVYGSGAQLGLSPPDAYTFAVYVVPTGVYHGTGPVRALVLDEFDRAAPRGTGSAKVGGNYAPVLRWSEKALKDGFGITLHLDSATHEDVEEFSTSGFIGALVEGEGEAEKVTLVVPDSQNIIESVTSDSVLEIGRSFGWNVAHRKVPYSELPRFKEVMAAGTAVTLVPIRSITRRLPAGGEETTTYLPDGQTEAGPLCLRLLARLKGIQLGTEPDHFAWCVPVEEADGTNVVRGGVEGEGEGEGETEAEAPSVDQLD